MLKSENVECESFMKILHVENYHPYNQK